MTTETEATVADKQPDSDAITIGAAFKEYFRESDEVKDEDKPKAFPEVQRFVRWIGEDQRVDRVIASEVARFSESYRSNASEEKKAQALHIKGFLNFLKKRLYTTDSLASHIRVRPRSNNGLRPVATRRNQNDSLMTREGYEELRARLEFIQKQKIHIADEIQRAAASGDVRENAPLEAAREEQGRLQSEERRIQSTLKSAQVIDESERLASKEVQIGSTVTIVKVGSTVTNDRGTSTSTELDGQEPMEYQVVSAHEVNPLQRKISNVSPVGSALMGKKSGDEVKVPTPTSTQLRYKIVSVN